MKNIYKKVFYLFSYVFLFCFRLYQPRSPRLSAELKDGTYAENKVIVMFRSDAVFVLTTRYKPNRNLPSNINSPLLSVTAVAL